MADTLPPSLPPLTLIIGGQRSGKSAHAEGLIGNVQPAVYVATGEVRDDEMAERVALHQERRGDNWITAEEPVDLGRALLEHNQTGRPILVDSLAMWVANLIEEGYDLETELFGLVDALERLTSPVVLVSDEVGLGVIPNNALARSFVDELGYVNQSLAGRADRVVFVAAGLPLPLKE